ncbi:MAG: ferritin-like domain-containing protein [Eubacteriales bacterium]
MNALEFAVNMEKDGEKFYRKQAEINSSNSLYTVCLLLAEEEKNHALLLSDMQNNISVEIDEADSLQQIKSIFKDIENFKSEIKELPTQLDFYTMALEKEKQSINLYKDLLSKATEDDENKLFEHLVQQEKRHYDILDELILRLSHAEDWVENAEFGLWSNRGEY